MGSVVINKIESFIMSIKGFLSLHLVRYTNNKNNFLFIKFLILETLRLKNTKINIVPLSFFFLCFIFNYEN